jgi:hypothetical protein
MVSLPVLGASTSKSLPKKYGGGILNGCGVNRFENDKKILYSTDIERCTQLKATQTYTHKNLNKPKRYDQLYCMRRFQELELQFEGKLD